MFSRRGEESSVILRCCSCSFGLLSFVFGLHSDEYTNCLMLLSSKMTLFILNGRINLQSLNYVPWELHHLFRSLTFEVITKTKFLGKKQADKRQKTIISSKIDQKMSNKSRKLGPMGISEYHLSRSQSF